ncbi:DUF4124 domain-containing protein [Pseudoalteromonas xiamenensis]
MSLSLLFAVSSWIASTASSVYKCDNGGTVVYSQFPCGDNQQVVTITPPPKMSTNEHADSIDNLKHQKTLEQVDLYVELEQIKREFEQLEGKRNRLMKQRDAKLDALMRKKQSANNNLAGAQWETSISQEMNAVSKSFDTDIKSLDARLDRLVEKIKAFKRP